jgi:hypothetical protein
LQKLALAWLRHEAGRRVDAELRAAESGVHGAGQAFRAVVQVNLLPRSH